MRRTVRGRSCPDTLAHPARLRKAQVTGGVAFYCVTGNPRGVADETKAERRAAALKAFGGRVKFAREQMGMTRIALARRCGFADASSITRVEDGHQMLDLIPLIEASRALKAPIDWLVTGEGELPSRDPAAPEERDQRRRQA